MDNVAMIGRLLVSLAAVLGVMWLLARRARKGMKGKGTRAIEVLDRANLTRSASVAVVRVNDRAFVLGVAEAQVTILAETDLAAAENATGNTAGTTARPRTHRARTERSHTVTTHRPATAATYSHETPPPAVESHARPTGPLAGSALSPQTWKQTIESLRDLTARP